MAVRVVTATVVHSLMFPAYLRLLYSVSLKNSLFTICEKPRVQPRYRLDCKALMVTPTALGPQAWSSQGKARGVQRPRLLPRPLLRPRLHLRPPNLFQGKKRLH